MGELERKEINELLAAADPDKLWGYLVYHAESHETKHGVDVGILWANERIEAVESRQLITLSLLNEARVKLEASAKPPTNLMKRIHEHFEDCCK